MKTLIHHFRDDKGTKAETLSLIVQFYPSPPPPLLSLVTVQDVFAKFNFCKVANRPFPSSLGPLYQNEVKCLAFDTEMIFHSHANKTHFHKKGCALGLILKVRVFGTRKSPITYVKIYFKI